MLVRNKNFRGSRAVVAGRSNVLHKTTRYVLMNLDPAFQILGEYAVLLIEQPSPGASGMLCLHHCNLIVLKQTPETFGL